MPTNDTDWKVALRALKKDFGLPAEAIGIFALQLRFRLEDIQAVAADSLTGGGDDKKSDILYVDKELEVAVIAQCYESTSAKPKSEAPSNKASDLNTAISWLLTRPLDDLPDGLRGRADELRAAIKAGEIKQLQIWYVHNLPQSKNVANELKTVEHTAQKALAAYDTGRDINVFAEEIGSEQLNRLYVQAERTIIVTDKFETRVLDAFEVEAAGWKSVSTVVSASWLYQLYRKYGTDLFSANLRGYLGSRASDSNINNGIKTTAVDEPHNFWVYNNGVTALVLDYVLHSRTKAGRRLTLNGMSIVNGAQTTGSLGSLDFEPDPSLMVPMRFVRAKNDVIVSNVVRYNNSQNKLQAADFRSNDQFQERLREEFDKVPGAEYEGGRRGGASDTIKRRKNVLPSYTVGQSLSAFHGDPVTAYDKKSEIWTNDTIYRRVFTERTTARHVVFCYSLLETVNSLRLELAQKQRKDENSLTQSEKRALTFLNRKGASFLVVDVIAKSMETILGRAVPNKFDLQFSSNISPEAGAATWRPIVDLVLSLSAQLDGAFSRNRISNETVQKAVPPFLGVIESLKDIHKQTFRQFASKITVVSPQ